MIDEAQRFEHGQIAFLSIWSSRSRRSVREAIAFDTTASSRAL
jgi:hypothetical protein